MNLELSKGATIALVVVAILVVVGLFWHLTRPKVVPYPPGYDFSQGTVKGGIVAPGNPVPTAPTK